MRQTNCEIIKLPDRINLQNRFPGFFEILFGESLIEKVEFLKEL